MGAQWTSAWLGSLGLGQYEAAFRDNDVDLGLLPSLTADDLRDLGVASVGHRRRLLAAIAAWARGAEPWRPRRRRPNQSTSARPAGPSGDS